MSQGYETKNVRIKEKTMTDTATPTSPVVKALTLGVHAVLVSDVASGDVALATGTKVFVSSLEPLMVSTNELSGIPVAREAIKTTKGRPRKIVAAATASEAPAASVAEQLAPEGGIDPTASATEV